jgi:hypothetical protein
VGGETWSNALIRRSAAVGDRAKGEEMIRWRLIALAALVAAAFAGCLTYFVIPLARVDLPLQATMPTLTGRIESLPVNIGPAAEQEATAAFERAAKTILKRLPDALAYAGADEPPITGRIPLPKRRPIPR